MNTANKHSLPDADDRRLLAEHTRVDFSLRARAIEKHFIYRLVPLAPVHCVHMHEYVVRRLSLEFQRSRNLLYKYYRATRWRRDKAIVTLCTLNNRVASYASVKHPIGVKGVAQKLNPIRLANKQSYIVQKAECDRT